ncbi:unnamed protein product [Protopolystoma xenopodis]|uniref:Uncharacterized protein n=1 Tax=Protopolystoma xenopodis TaxID=117903 RepID=A0A448XNF0_9PLAT|nr:unnamed protein product [Protopolystoma xenopodis]
MPHRPDAGWCRLVCYNDSPFRPCMWPLYLPVGLTWPRCPHTFSPAAPSPHPPATAHLFLHRLYALLLLLNYASAIDTTLDRHA